MLFALAGNLERYRIAAVRRVQKGAAEPWADLSGRRIFPGRPPCPEATAITHFVIAVSYC